MGVNGEFTVNDILNGIEEMFYLTAYDEDSPPEDLRGNLRYAREVLDRWRQALCWMNDNHIIRDENSREVYAE